MERKTSDEPARPCPKAPRERRAPRGASSQRRSFRGVSCPPAHGPPAPPGRVCLSRLRPQRPERRPRVLGTHYGNERPSGGSCRDSDSEAGGRWGCGAVAPCGEGARPPPRISRRPLIHTRGSGGLLVRVSRGRHPPQRTRGRPAPSDHRTRWLLSTGRAAEPRGAPGGSRHRGRGRRSPGPLFDRGSKSFKNVTRPMALKRRDAKPSGTVPRQQSHEDTPGRFLWSRARGPGPCGGCGVAHTPQGHGDSGLTGCPRERGRRPALHTMPRDGPREPSALKARSWRSTPRRPRPRGPRAAVGLTLRTETRPRTRQQPCCSRDGTRAGPGLWLSPRAGPSDHPTTTPARKPRRSCRV